jgi:hypothetical protein
MDHERLSREHGCSYQNEPAQWQKTSDQTGSGRHEDVLRNKNEPYDISSMGFPLQRNLGEEPGLGLLGGWREFPCLVNSQRASSECKSYLCPLPFAIREFQARPPIITILHELDMDKRKSQLVPSSLQWH